MIFKRRPRRSELRKVEDALPEAFNHLARLLRAGQGLSMALTTLTETLDEPLKRAFAEALSEHRQGRSLDYALLRVVDRYPLPDLKLMGVAIRVQRETGGNLTEVVEKLAQTIRDRQLMRAELQAYTAEARLSATLLSILPVLCAGALYLWRAQDFAHFAETPIGQMLLIGIVIAMLLGVTMTRFLLRRLEQAL